MLNQVNTVGELPKSTIKNIQPSSLSAARITLPTKIAVKVDQPKQKIVKKLTVMPIIIKNQNIFKTNAKSINVKAKQLKSEKIENLVFNCQSTKVQNDKTNLLNHSVVRASTRP